MPHKARKLLAVLLAPAVVVFSPSWASSSQVEDNPLSELEKFEVTATRRKAFLLDIVEPSTLVDAERVAREAPGTVAELLRGQVGTYFQQTTPGQGIPIIRGLKGSEVLHLVDGMRLNNAIFRNAPNQYLGLVDAYAIERMEVIRGSAASLHGADAMGGVVQVLTGEPEFKGESWTAQGRLYGTYNSVANEVTARAGAAAGNEGTAISGGVTWQKFDDRTVGGGDVVSPTGYELEAGDLKWRQGLSANSELMVSAQVAEQPSTPRIDELVPGYGQTTPASAVSEFQPNRRSFLHARYVLQSDSALFRRMELHAARQVITDDRLTQDYGSTLQTREGNESALNGFAAQFNTPWGGSSGSSNEVVWGFEYYADEVSSSRLRTNLEDGSTSRPAPRFPDNSTMDSYAAYAANRFESGPWVLEAGLRYSGFDILLPESGVVPEVDLSPDDVTGDVHAAMALNEGLNLVANIGRGFRPPNIFDLGTLGPRPGNRYNKPNPDLKPETVYSYDLGLKGAGTAWEAECFVFYSRYEDRITSRLTGEVMPDGRLVVRSENLNEATLYGIESGARYHFTRAFEGYAVLNYTHAEEEDITLGEVPGDRIPPLNGRLGLIYAPGNPLRLEAWIDWSDNQDRLSPRDVADPRVAPGGTPGYVTANVILGWKAAERLELGMRFENVLDENYREHGSGLDAEGFNLGFWVDALF